MVPNPTTAVKICTVCGVDCAGRPRIKDQLGRYICKECFDKAKQTKQALKNPPVLNVPAVRTNDSPSSPEGDNSFLLELNSKESTGIDGAKPCPECGRPLSTSAVLCVGCGFNLSTGKRLGVKVVRAKKEKSSAGGAAAEFGGSMLFCIIGGAIGGAIGAGIWAAVAYFTQFESGWIAWALGGLSGAGCAMGARAGAGTTTGGIAAGIAIAAILVGKFIAGSLILQSMGLGSAPVDVWFPKMFAPFDALWFFLAISTAYRVGSRSMGS